MKYNKQNFVQCVVIPCSVAPIYHTLHMPRQKQMTCIKKSFVDQIEKFSAFSFNSATQIVVPFQNTTDTFYSNYVT